jgi:hypothetical protein
MTTTIENTSDLLTFLVNQSEGGNKQWFGWIQQRMTGVALAHQIAANHADKMTPDEVVDYVTELNNSLFNRMIKPRG